MPKKRALKTSKGIKATAVIRRNKLVGSEKK